jgi:hypothetical protein
LFCFSLVLDGLISIFVVDDDDVLFNFQFVYFRDYFLSAHFLAGRRVHENMCANPVVPMPWLVVHPITPDSPFYGKTLKEAADQHFEIIAIFNGVDEYSSFSVQPGT